MRAERHLGFLLACVLLAGASRAPAATFVVATNYVLGSNETVRTELWLQAETVVVQGTIEDDLFLLATARALGDAGAPPPPAIALAGTMQGDVWALGESIRLTGSIAEHARLAGLKTIHVDGSIGRGLMAAANAIYLGPRAQIAGDVLLFGRLIMTDGHIGGSARLQAGKVILSGTFDGNVHVTADDITVTPGTTIAGNLTYRMDRQLILDPGVTVGGKLVRAPPMPAPSSGSWRTRLPLQIFLYLAALLVGMIFSALFPGHVALAVMHVEHSFWRTLLIGFVIFALLPMVAFLFLLTIVGIPLALMLGLAYLMLLYLSKIIAALYLGRLLLRSRLAPGIWGTLSVLTLGLVVVYVAANLPFPIDAAARFGFLFLGIGGMVRALADQRWPLAVPARPPGTPPVPPPGPTPKMS